MPISVPALLAKLPVFLLALTVPPGCAPPHVATAPTRSAASGPASPTAQLSPPASPKAALPDTPIDAATRARVIDTALEKIVANYVAPNVAAKIAASVRPTRRTATTIVPPAPSPSPSSSRHTSPRSPTTSI